MLRLNSGLVCVALLIAFASSSIADEKPAIQSEYYLGESKMMTPTGQVVRTGLSLVKRVLNRTENRIEAR